MPKYDVYVYPIVRVLMEDIEADSPEEACKKAEASVNWDATLSSHTLSIGGDVLDIEFADDFDGFMVDWDVEASEYDNSTWYDYKASPPERR